MTMMIHLIWGRRREWGAREEDSQRVQRGTFGEKGLLTVVIVWMSRYVIYSNANVLKMHLCEPWVSRHSPGNTRMQQALTCSHYKKGSCRPL